MIRYCLRLLAFATALFVFNMPMSFASDQPRTGNSTAENGMPGYIPSKKDNINPETGFRYLPHESLTIQTTTGQDYIFDVEMPKPGAEQARGLMNRPHLNSDSGMLFVFGSEETPAFWMKDTLIPLDMLFIAHDGTINHIHHNARPLDETMITTHSPALAVLEINGGTAGTLGIKEGDKVLHPAFRNVLSKQ